MIIKEGLSVPGPPFFIEAPATQQADVNICAKIMRILFEHKIRPIPFASSLADIDSILTSLKTRNIRPSIFLVNTFGAKEILKELNPVLGELPTLYFRRSLHAGESGMSELLPDPNKNDTMEMIGKFTPRLTSVWMYGGKNSGSIAQHAAAALLKFLGDGDFKHIEKAVRIERL